MPAFAWALEPRFEESITFLVVSSPDAQFEDSVTLPVLLVITDNGPNGDSIGFGGESGHEFTLNLEFSDPSGRALNSDAWTSRYEPSFWRKIVF